MGETQTLAHADEASRRRFLRAFAAFGVGVALMPGAIRSARAIADQGGGMIKLAFCMRRLPHL